MQTPARSVPRGHLLPLRRARSGTLRSILPLLLLVTRIGWAACGDGVVDVGEACDLAAGNGTPTSCCSAACALATAGTLCRPVAGACDLAERCDGVTDACPDDVVAADDTSCDDANACTTGDRCGDGVCRGVAPVCGNGQVDVCEFCDHGAANGAAGSCCASDCRPVSYGTACADDGDLCTQDRCEGSQCTHVVAPPAGCHLPVVPARRP